MRPGRNAVHGLAQVDAEFLRLAGALAPDGRGPHAARHGGNRHAGAKPEATIQDRIAACEGDGAAAIRGASADVTHEAGEGLVDVEIRFLGASDGRCPAGLCDCVALSAAKAPACTTSDETFASSITSKDSSLCQAFQVQTDVQSNSCNQLLQMCGVRLAKNFQSFRGQRNLQSTRMGCTVSP